MLNYTRVMAGSSKMTPSRLLAMGRRKQQQKQAIANLYGKLTPAQRKTADTKMRRSRLMNG